MQLTVDNCLSESDGHDGALPLEEQNSSSNDGLGICPECDHGLVNELYCVWCGHWVGPITKEAKR